MTFPNRAGNHPDNDAVLRAELEAAGIKVTEHEFLRDTSREVKTAVIGTLHGWVFTREWYYWVCKGPGIEVAAAERLHAAHGQTVRVDGHCGCPSPREAFHGLACGLYHVDDAPGLKALADTIKELVASRGPWHPASEPPKQTEWVIASADGAVRCMAWNSDNRRWEDWDGVGAIDPDLIDRWMSIPKDPT